MKVVFSTTQLQHVGRKELTEGALVPCFECPERATIILNHLEQAGFPGPETPPDSGSGPITAVHDPAYVRFLTHAYGEWRDEHGPESGDALPTAWAVHGLRKALPRRIDGRLGYYGFDAGTPIGPGTWQGAYAAAQTALHGAALVAGGEPAVYALSRPPGHHAHRALYGGYCYLNNAAIAARALIEAGCERVAILDIDYHHGNGTQDIFYHHAEVLTVSLHADPRDSYPYFLGHADETGAASGAGCNLNLPLAHGTEWPQYAVALSTAGDAVRRFAPGALVVSLGVDTYEGDPLSRFRIGAEDFVRIGANIAGLGLPTLFVQEGGYVSEALGRNVVSVLRGFLDA